MEFGNPSRRKTVPHLRDTREEILRKKGLCSFWLILCCTSNLWPAQPKTTSTNMAVRHTKREADRRTKSPYWARSERGAQGVRGCGCSGALNAGADACWWAEVGPVPAFQRGGIECCPAFPKIASAFLPPSEAMCTTYQTSPLPKTQLVVSTVSVSHNTLKWVQVLGSHSTKPTGFALCVKESGGRQEGERGRSRREHVWSQFRLGQADAGLHQHLLGDLLRRCEEAERDAP